MDLSYSAEYEDYRAELRQFLERHWTDEDANSGPPDTGLAAMMGGVVRTDARGTAFRLQAIERGYLYRHVPRRYGGSEQPADPLKATIIGEEFRRRRAPGELFGQGPSMLVPTLVEHGTEEQKQAFVRDTLIGKIVWCQGYSEPNAGSDLASLRTRAEIDGDFWVVNGQKIWTSTADSADWMFCLVRTEFDKPKHEGISYLLIDMKTPGIEVRPLRQMTGDVEFHEVFLENVRVPVKNLVGKRGQGWIVSRSTLKHERALIGGAAMQRRTMEGLIMMAQGLNRRGMPAIQDPVLRNRLMALQTRLRAAEYHGHRLLTMHARNVEPGMAGMITKLYGTVLGYDIAKCAMDVLADGGNLTLGEPTAPGMGMFPFAYMWSLGNLIAGGTANIQRNIIAERGLGLPRDPATRR